MQRHKRRQDTAACTCEAVRLLTEPGYGGTDTARNLGMHAHRLGRWTRQVAQQHSGVCRGNGHLSAEHAARLRLRKEVKRLRMERESVKKPVSFFASESS